MKVVQFSPSGSPELPVRSNFLPGKIVRGQSVFSIRDSTCAKVESFNKKNRAESPPNQLIGSFGSSLVVPRDSKQRRITTNVLRKLRMAEYGV